MVEKLSRGKIAIPEDFLLGPVMDAMAKRHGMTSDVANHEWEAFKAHHISKGNKFRRWDMAWLTWVLNWKKWNAPKAKTEPPKHNLTAEQIRELRRQYYERKARE